MQIEYEETLKRLNDLEYMIRLFYILRDLGIKSAQASAVKGFNNHVKLIADIV